MEFFDPYLKDVGSILSWLAKFETSVSALQVVQSIAAFLGIILSTLGIYKAWRYAEKRLGKRLDEFLDHQEDRIVAARRALQVAHKQIAVAQPDPSSLFTRRELKVVLRPLGARFYSSSKSALNDALARTDEREQLARKKSGLHLKQKAMDHLLLGAVASAERDHQKALVHFQSALDIDEHDVEALEYLGFQHLRLGDGNQALSLFSKLESIARARGDALLVSRALRNCGLAYQRLPTPSHSNANISFRDAINEFPSDGPAYDLAHIHELRGQANVLQKRPRLAQTCLTRALTGYSALEHGNNGDIAGARAGVKRVIAALEALKQIQIAANAPQAEEEGDDANTTSQPQLPLNQQQATQQLPDSERPN
jgi:tetratricopeptide (TPR) repeat protein